jgi:midasin
MTKGGTAASLVALCAGVAWTQSFRRMYSLLDRCLQHSEPALLVGETGTGKTTACQLAAFLRNQQLHIINCNQYTETSDFIGGFRPNRHRDQAWQDLQTIWTELKVLSNAGFDLAIEEGPNVILNACYDMLKRAKLDGGCTTSLKDILQRLEQVVARLRAPFEWVDGPLLQAMKSGDILLIDEINLANDAVLERLNRSA